MTDPLRTGIADLLRKGSRRSASPAGRAVTAKPVPRAPGRKTGRSAGGGVAAAAPDVPEDAADLVAAIEGATLQSIGGRTVCVVRRDLEELLPDASLHRSLTGALATLADRDPASVYPGLRPAVGAGIADLVILDLETTGFWGCPVFLAGLLFEENGRLVSVQVLARDYPEEPAMLAAASLLLRGRKVLVTFNGKSYDVPCFRERCDYHRVRTSIHDMPHVDVLHASRRRWRDELPDCRLQTLEWEVVGLHRTGDIPSAEIPAVYHEFAATGDPRDLQGVLHHGRVDTVTTASLLARLLEDPPPPPEKRRRKKTE